jgi:methylated-DNA-[protein]-cysteine S-methyltransferase
MNDTDRDRPTGHGDDVVVRRLRAAAAVDESDADDRQELSRLHADLAASAAQEGLLDVAYRVVDGPLGPLLVAATELGVVRVAFDVEDHDRVLEDLASRISPRVLLAPDRTDRAARELDEYFAGRRRTFDVALDLRLVRGFRRDVVAGLAGIPYGATESYAQVAARAGRPRAVRAVGSACSHNPVPVVLPCHRVVRSDGSLGQYLGGVEAKAALLALEGALAG